MQQIVEAPVDINNEFCYNGTCYRISPLLKQYEVKDYPVITNGKYNNWTNTCDMDSVIVIDYDSVRIRFLDQDGEDITDLIKQV